MKNWLDMIELPYTLFCYQAWTTAAAEGIVAIEGSQMDMTKWGSNRGIFSLIAYSLAVQKNDHVKKSKFPSDQKKSRIIEVFVFFPFFFFFSFY